MTLLTAGNLGDVLIQAAVLKSLGIAPKKIIAPSNYVDIAKEVYGVEVISLKAHKTECRLAIFSGCDREVLYNEIINQISPQIGNEEIFSLVLTDEEIYKRSKNIYQCYRDLFSKRFGKFKLDQYDFQPLRALPVASGSAKKNKQILICPVGGIGVKTLPVDVLKEICNFAQTHSYTVKIMLTSLDKNPYAESGLNYDVERIEVSQGMLKKICEVFEKSRLIISVDTAWYHLASIQGFGAIPIPGPRSVNHFAHPNDPLFNKVFKTSLSCMDCYSGSICVASRKPVCEAKPSPQEIIQVISERLEISAIDMRENQKNDLSKMKGKFSLNMKLKLHLKFLAPIIRFSITHPRFRHPATKLFQLIKFSVKLIR